MLHRDFEHLQVLRSVSARAAVVIAIDSTRLGPAFGGIRRWVYRDLDAAVEDALDLARAMTRKCALAGIPGGGGKSVVVPAEGHDRRAAYRLLGRQVEALRGRYFTGPDVGTETADLEVVAQETRFVARPGPDGPGDLAESTAFGVHASIVAVAHRLGHADLRGVRIAVQGLGAVGARLAESLAHAGARLVVADLRQDHAQRLAAAWDAEVVAIERILAVPCDVFAPCALGGVLDEAALASLRARAIAGAANNVLAAPGIGERLFARGVLYAPDFVANAGALIHGALFHLEGRAPPRARIAAIGDVVGELLDRAARERVPPEVLATHVADERVANAAPNPLTP